MTSSSIARWGDFLGYQIPTSITSIPGHWLLDLPFSPSFLSIRRFAPSESSPRQAIPAAESSSDAARRAAAEALLAQQDGDELEVAWRAINSIGANERDGGPGQVLHTPCALVVPADTGTARELWLFEVRGPNGSTVDQYHHEVLDSLTASGDDTETFDITDMLYCETHKDASSCLSPGSTCQVEWRPETLLRSWRHFTCAVVEKLAWRNGKRETTLRSPGAALKATHLHSLKLVTPHKLLLTAPPIIGTRQAEARPFNDPLNPAQKLLLPMHTPAVRLGPFEPNPIQQHHLETSSRTTLGPGWDYNARRGTILSAPTPAWSVYWVPPSERRDASTHRDHPADGIAGEKSSNPGILVVWPTHLTRSTCRTSRTPSSVSKTLKRPVSAITDAPPAIELMNISSSLFAFMSTYKEPPPPEAETETSPPPADSTQPPDIPTPMTGPTATESTPRLPFEMDVYGSGTPKSAGASKRSDLDADIDDLFSSEPTSPVAIPQFQPAPDQDEVERAGTIDDFDDLFGTVEQRDPIELARDVEMHASPSPAPVAEYPVTTNQAMEPYDAFDDYGAGDELDMNQLTEADFAFLDSPDETAAPDSAVLDPDAPPIPDAGTSTKAEALESSLGVTLLKRPPISEGGDTGTSTGDAARSPEGVVGETITDAGPDQGLGDGATDVSRSVGDDGEDAARTQQDASSQVAIGNAGKDVKHEALPPSPESDLIPSPFSPLTSIRFSIQPNAHVPYPSPATTPEALRTDLTERLHQAKKQKSNTDYSLAWHIEEDLSEIEDEYDDSGAPPTPDSQDDDTSSEDDTGSASPQACEMTEGETILKWKGHTCVAAEWVWLRDRSDAVDVLAKPWNDDWLDSSSNQADPDTLPSLPASPSAERRNRLDKVEVARLAREVIGNRFFRRYLRDSSDLSIPDSDAWSIDLGEPARLSNLLPIEEPSMDAAANDPVRSLGPCNVHAGFAGNVMRLSVAGLRYWRQLGLSPVGGEKSLKAFVITLPGEGFKRAAENLLKSMERVWQEHRLGQHSASISVGTNGVLQVGLSEIASVIVPVARQNVNNGNSVTYILLEDDSLDSQPLLQALAKPLPESRIVHVVPLSAIRPQSLPDLAFDVYNRIPRLLHRVESRGTPLPGPPTYFQYPSFTLAADSPPKPTLSLSWPLQSYDMLNRWRFVHAAYTLHAGSGLLIAFVMDAEGENYDVRNWHSTDMTELDRIRELWKFFVEFAEVAAIEWRMTITSVGEVSNDHVQNWGQVIGHAYVTLLNVTSGASPSLGLPSIIVPPAPSNIPPPVWSSASARITDNTLIVYTAKIPLRIPVSTDDADKVDRAIYPTKSFILTMHTGPDTPAAPPGSSSSPATTAVYHVLSHRAAPGREDEMIEEVLSREIQKSAYLARLRFGLPGRAKGVHVEAVEAIYDALLPQIAG